MRAALSRRWSSEAGGVASGLVVAIIVLAAAGVAAFFWLGGEADVDIKTPDTQVTTTDSG